MSVKIIIAEKTNKSLELYNLRAIAERSNGNPNSVFIVQLLDDFIHEGPNGSHQCLVLELLGPTVSLTVKDYFEVGDRLDTEDILKISKQLLVAVAFMHKDGCAHGGIVGNSLFFYLPAMQLSTLRANFL